MLFFFYSFEVDSQDVVLRKNYHHGLKILIVTDIDYFFKLLVWRLRPYTRHSAAHNFCINFEAWHDFKFLLVTIEVKKLNLKVFGEHKQKVLAVIPAGMLDLFYG